MGLEDKLYPLLRLYEASPQPVKSLVGSAYRKMPVSLRLGASYKRFREEAEASESWSADEIADYQFRELRNTLTTALENCSYYRDLYKKHSFALSDFNSPGDLTKLPTISKPDVINHREDMANASIPRKRRLYMTTGGSTGVPVGFYLEKGIGRPKEQAYLEAMWRRAGFFDGARLAVIRGQVTDRNGKKIHYQDATRDWLILSSYHLTQARIPEYLERLNNFAPECAPG